MKGLVLFGSTMHTLGHEMHSLLVGASNGQHKTLILNLSKRSGWVHSNARAELFSCAMQGALLSGWEDLLTRVGIFRWSGTTF